MGNGARSALWGYGGCVDLVLVRAWVWGAGADLEVSNSNIDPTVAGRVPTPYIKPKPLLRSPKHLLTGTFVLETAFGDFQGCCSESCLVDHWLPRFIEPNTTPQISTKEGFIDQAVERYTFLLSRFLGSYYTTIKPKKYLLFPQGLLNSLIKGYPELIWALCWLRGIWVGLYSAL